MRVGRWWLGVALMLAGSAVAQEQLEVEGPAPSTVRLGDSARVTIRVEGRGANPRTPELPKVVGLTMQLSAPSRSSYTFFDGRTMIERQGVQYQLTLRPDQAGDFVVPPFPIWTGTKDQLTPELRLTVVKDLRGEDLGWIDVRVEPTRVYVHEPIRISVEFGIEPGLRLVQDVYQRTRYLDVEVQAPWLSRFPGGERIAVPDPKGDLRAIISNRELFAAAYDGSFSRDGKRWQRFAFERAFLPTRTGKQTLSAPTLRFHVLRRAGRTDIFGRNRGGQSENMFVYGKPVEIEVLPIPAEGRPTPYYGAVGRFSIDASLDRDSVKVGSSVKLQLTVRGQGNLEFLRLPQVEDLAGFHKLGQAEAQRDAEKVVVTYDLAPLSAELEAVPPIAWNFFDTTPGVERFIEVTTPALPLHVEALADGETLAVLPSADALDVTPGVDDIFDLPDLSGPALRRQPSPAWQAWVAALLPWVLVALGVLGFSAWRRRAADTSGQRARAAMRTLRTALTDGVEPADALAAYLGDRFDQPPAAFVRADLAGDLERAGVAAELAGAIGEAIQRGTEARYGGGAAVTAAEVEALASRLESARIDRRGWASMLFVALLFGGELPAQSSAPTEAIAAYRAADYERADALFAQAFAATADRRLLQARGNCLFRLDRLPEALWAFESARLGAPRDPELLANIRLVRQRLGLAEPAAGFLAELEGFRQRMTPLERITLLAAGMLAAALCLIAGWRRPGARWIGVIVLLPSIWLTVEAVWFDPVRNVRAVALEKLSLTSEPRADLEAVATVRRGVIVELLGGTEGTFARIAADQRSGYVPSSALAPVR